MPALQNTVRQSIYAKIGGFGVIGVCGIGVAIAGFLAVRRPSI